MDTVANSSVYQQVDFGKDAEASTFINKTLEDKRRYQYLAEGQALFNAAWYKGYQDIYYDASTGTFIRMPNDRKRARLIYNQIMPWVENLTADLGSDEIRYDVSPATGELSDAMKAMLSTAVLEHYREKLDLDELCEELDLFSALHGCAYVKVCWNPLAGDDIDLSEGTEYDAKEFRKIYGVDPVQRMGEPNVEVVPLVNLYWGPPGGKFKDAEWCVEVNERSIGYVAERYDVKPDELRGDGDVRSERRVWRMSDVSANGVAERHSESGETVLVAEFWGIPTGKFPDGVHVVMAGGKILNKKRENPYRHKRLPYVQFRMLIPPDSPTGMSYVDNLVRPQSDINAAMSQSYEIRETMANPRIFAQQGSIPDVSQWTGVAGGINFYSGQKPEVQPGSNVPSSIFHLLERSQRFGQDIVAAHDVSQGKVPAGTRSGRMVLAVQEGDTKRRAQIRKRRWNCWQYVGRLLLSTIAQYADEQRLVKIVGANKRYTVKWFKGEDLVGGGLGLDYYDVRVQRNGLANSRLAQLDLVDTLTQNKTLDPVARPEDRKLVLDILQVGSNINSVDPHQSDRDIARDENDRMLAGQPALPDHEEHCDIHLEEHAAFKKTPEFRALPPDHPCRAAIDEHIRATMHLMAYKAIEPKILIQAVINQAAGMMPPAPGMPPGGMPPDGPAGAPQQNSSVAV